MQDPQQLEQPRSLTENVQGGSPSYKRIFALLNPIAGGSDVQKVLRALQRHFSQTGSDLEVYETTGHEDIAQITRTACEKGANLVIAAGGDGTVAGIVNGLSGYQVPLGVLPVGTGNGLARALGIPLELDSAVKLLSGEHKVMKIDALGIGEQIYLMNVSAGVSARAMQGTSPRHKRRFGILAYVWEIARQLLGFQLIPFQLSIDGLRVHVRASEILVSNTALVEDPPFPLGPPKKFYDRRLEVYALTARTIFDYLRLIWDLLFQAGKHKPEVYHWTIAQRVHINSSSPQPVQADGEVIGYTPVEVRLIPEAIQVIVPKDLVEDG